MTATAAAPSLRVVSVRGKGRGVVAARRFAEREVVERDPVLVIPAGDWPHLQQTVVSKYCFLWHEGRDEAAVALGYGSLFNHAYTPNVMAQIHLRERVIEFVAVRDIAEGEEITLNYNGDPDATGPVGFRVRR